MKLINLKKSRKKVPFLIKILIDMMDLMIIQYLKKILKLSHKCCYKILLNNYNKNKILNNLRINNKLKIVLIIKEINN
jgi:hypothetical protein